MKGTTVTHNTSIPAEILFLAVRRPLLNDNNNKEEYSIKVRLSNLDPAVSHISMISPKKIQTMANAKAQDNAHTILSFASQFKVVVTDQTGRKLEDEELPFFNSKTDKGKALVLYNVITYDTKTIIRLAGIKLVELELAPREAKSDPVESILEKIREIG